MTGSKAVKRVVGASAALALAGGVMVGTAGTAEAKNLKVWDKVAQCESSGNWKINTGNGFYGGLQFTPSTWRGFGGATYASSAHKATKAEQIAIARRVLKVQGPGAWPVCSQRAGLTKANGGADRNAKAGESIATESKKKASPKRAKAGTAKKSAAPKRANYATVKSGDTIAKIAHRYDTKGGWRGLWKLNKSKVKNPNMIYVGERLRVR